MIRNDQEYQVTLERIAYFQQQITKLRGGCCGIQSKGKKRRAKEGKQPPKEKRKRSYVKNKRSNAKEKKRRRPFFG